MKVNVEDIGACRKELFIEFSPEETGTEYDKLLGLYRKGAKIPGFRPGKAPDYVVKKRFSKELQEGVRDELIPQGYRQAINEQNLDVVNILNVHDVNYKPGETLSFGVTLDVPPDFKLPEYKGIKLKSELKDVADEDVQKAMDDILGQFGTFEDIEGRPVQEGDVAQIDYSSTVDGTPLADLEPDSKGLADGEDFWMRVDENCFVPGLEKGMIGMQVGEEREIPVSFDDSFVKDSLAGRNAVYTVKVKALREKKPAAMNEEFFGRLGVKDEADLRDKIKEDLESRASGEENRRLQNELIQHLLKKTKMKDLPESVVQNETRDIIYDMVKQNTSQGVSQEDLESKREEIYETAARSAEDRVRVKYILYRIAEDEEINVNDQEVDQRIFSMSRYYGSEPAKLKEDLVKRNAIDNLKEQIRSEKTLDYLLEQADVNQK